jgi:hypothetical protein
MEPPSPHPVEIEAKFSILNAQLLHKLAAPGLSLSGYRFGAPVIKQMTDIYLDTPDYRLLRTGYQLRARHSAGTMGWQRSSHAASAATSASITGWKSKNRWQQRGAPATIGDLPPAIIAALAGIVAPAQSLASICVIALTRRVRDVIAGAPGRRRSTAQRLAILSLDEMVIQQCASDPPLARLYEVEVELAPDVDAAELQVLADRLIGAYALRPSQESKLERALGVLSRHPAGSPEKLAGIAASHAHGRSLPHHLARTVHEAALERGWRSPRR